MAVITGNIKKLLRLEFIKVAFSRRILYAENLKERFNTLGSILIDFLAES